MLCTSTTCCQVDEAYEYLRINAYRLRQLTGLTQTTYVTALSAPSSGHPRPLGYATNTSYEHLTISTNSDNLQYKVLILLYIPFKTVGDILWCVKNAIIF